MCNLLIVLRGCYSSSHPSAPPSSARCSNEMETKKCLKPMQKWPSSLPNPDYYRETSSCLWRVSPTKLCLPPLSTRYVQVWCKCHCHRSIHLTPWLRSVAFPESSKHDNGVENIVSVYCNSHAKLNGVYTVDRVWLYGYKLKSLIPA